MPPPRPVGLSAANGPATDLRFSQVLHPRIDPGGGFLRAPGERVGQPPGYNAAMADRDPLDYRAPVSDDVVRRRRAQRALWVGAGAVAAAVLLVLAPLVLARSAVNKYIVLAGFLAGCWGLSCLLLGGYDWWKSR